MNQLNLKISKCDIFVGIIVAVIGIVNFINGFNDLGNVTFFIGMLMFTFGLFVGLFFLIVGFNPELRKMATKTTKYILNENKEEFAEISKTHAEIVSEAIHETSKTVKEDLNPVVFCKYCGKKIDEDSKFCKYCGKNLE